MTSALITRWLPILTLAALAGALVRLLPTQVELLPLLIALGIMALGGFLISRGPVLCLAAIASLAYFGWTATLASIGPLDIRASDPLFVALAVSTLASPRAMSPGERRSGGGAFRTASLFFVLLGAFAGLSTFQVALREPMLLEASFVSWLRLIATGSLAWFAARTFQSDRDLATVFQLMNIAGVGAVVAALWHAKEGAFLDLITERYGGLVNVNTLGLISGLLVVASFVQPSGIRGSNRVLIGVAGVLGLGLSKSITALLATACAIVLARIVLDPSRTPGAARVLRFVGTAIAGSLLVLLLVQSLRPSALPFSPDFSGSTSLHRIIVASAGLEVFASSPIIGVGWRRSSSPEVLGDSAVALNLRERFAEANPRFFPDVSPTSVHSAYVQVLAELGVIGFLLLAMAIVHTANGIRMLLGESAPRAVRRRDVVFLAAAFVLTLLWWQGNPIFGGQTETIAAAIFYGALSAIAARGAEPPVFRGAVTTSADAHLSGRR